LSLDPTIGRRFVLQSLGIEHRTSHDARFLLWLKAITAFWVRQVEYRASKSSGDNSAGTRFR
jgi:hypothetical protein